MLANFDPVSGGRPWRAADTPTSQVRQYGNWFIWILYKVGLEQHERDERV